MLDHRLARIALQTRLLATIIATTGDASIEATANGYVRAVGSFEDDGFVVGLEVTPAGFPTNAVDVVVDVAPLTLTTRRAHTASVAAPGRSLTARLPQRRAFTGTLDPVSGESSLRGEYVPATNTTETMASQDGHGEETGLYVVTFIAPTDYGDDVFDVTLGAILPRFAPGTLLDAGAHTLSMRWKPAPQRGKVQPYPTAGLSYLQGTIAWKAQTRTAVLA